MATNLNVAGEGQVMQNGLVCMKYDEFTKLEPRTLQIMNNSEAILVTLPDNDELDELFSRIVNIYKEDAEKPKKKRIGYDNILETVVLFIDKQDYPDFSKPIASREDAKDQIDSSATQTKGALGKLLRDLQKWGGLNEEDAIYYLDPANIQNLGEVMKQI